MAKYRHALPQLSGGIFLTDGGMETTLLFQEGWDLPCFAAFHLMRTPEGTAALRNYYRTYAKLARDHGLGFVLESATWRASRDWGAKLGYSAAELEGANRRAIALLAELRQELEMPASPMVISGNVGPRGDGYVPGQLMSASEAQRYHAEQIGIYRQTEADMVTAMTINYVEEAVGIARAAEAAAMPVVISFTVETDGKLPTGHTLGEAIEIVDAASEAGPAYFMINCAHPTHLEAALPSDESWVRRIRGLRANASKRSHAELDQATDLDSGNPVELGREYRELRRRHGHINVLGGCCGTDHRHVSAICNSCVPHHHAAYAA